jgi:hypothetical protein
MAKQSIVVSSVNGLRKKLTRIAFIAVMIGVTAASEQAFAMCCCQSQDGETGWTNSSLDCDGQCVAGSICDPGSQKSISHSASQH